MRKQFDYLTIEEVAILARYNDENSIRRLIAKGAIRSVRVGGKRVIPRDAAAEFLKGA